MGLLIFEYVKITVYLSLTDRYSFPDLIQEMSCVLSCVCPWFAEDPAGSADPYSTES